MTRSRWVRSRWSGRIGHNQQQHERLGSEQWPGDYTGTVQNTARPGGTLVDGALVTYNYAAGQPIGTGRIFDL